MRHIVPATLFLAVVGCAPEDLFGFGIDVESTGDTAATATSGEPAAVAPTPCAASVGAPQWSIAMRWEWDGVAADPDYRQVVVAPVAGDLDGDGLPEVIAVALRPDDGLTPEGIGYLVVLDGSTGQEILAVPDVYGLATRLVVYDLDGDGDDEVLAQVGGQLAALDLSGVVWTAAGCDTWNPPAAADLDADGDVEVVYGACGILDGATGQTVVAPWGRSRQSGNSAEYTQLVDLDGDGLPEITLNADVRDATGALVDQLPAGTYRTLPIAGGASTRSVVSRTASFQVLDAGLQSVGGFDADASNPLICSGDVDHDGDAELIVPGENDLTLRELDGASVWSASEARVVGYPGANACLVTDLDADGCLDVVWPQNAQPRVYDAATGALRTAFVAAGAATAVMEAPPLVDLDGDGTLELVVSAQDLDTGGDPTWTGIRAFGETSGAWIGPVP